MSHFSVLVFTKGCPSDDELSEILAPWHEFECTGLDNQYVKDIDVTEDTRKDYEESTKTRYKDPQGILHDPYLDRFYREPTAKEKKDMGSWGGTGATKDFSYTSRDWGDGQGYRAKIHFIPEGWEEVEIPTKDIQTFAEYVEDWHEKTLVKEGQTVTKDCKYGYAIIDDNGNILKVIRRTNPNAKWNEWRVGGRYANKFSMKNPKDDPSNWQTCTLCCGTGMRNDETGKNFRLENPKYTCNGCEGKGKILKWSSDWETEGDQVRIADINYVELHDKAVKEREDWVLDIMNKSDSTREDVALACELKHSIDKEWRELSEPKPRGKEYNEWVGAKGGDYLTFVKIKSKVWDLPNVPEGKTLDEWVLAAPPITTFAYVKDGEWHERGKMGWWACVSNETVEKDWDTEVADLFANFNDDDWVTCVDCHI